MSEVTLLIEGKEFKFLKEQLYQYSDYFRAMFGGSFLENEQKTVNIDVIDATSMTIIRKYVENGLIDLTEYPLRVLGDLAVSANFLQMTELLKQLDYTLNEILSESTWMEIMNIAEMASFSNLEKFAPAFGLLSFKTMQPHNIPTFEKLFWYLSHPYLNTHSEYKVFEFGFKWIAANNLPIDLILVILGCLDLKKLTLHEAEQMCHLMMEHVTSLAAKMIECLTEMLKNNWPLNSESLTEHSETLTEKFTTIVLDEVHQVILTSCQRTLKFVPCVPLSIIDGSHQPGSSCTCTWSEDSPGNCTCRKSQHLYSFDETSGFEKWLNVAVHALWGWSLAAWGAHRLALVGGEYGRGTGWFMRTVSVWDALRLKWDRHGVELPSRRHAGVAVLGDKLYQVGGVGSFRVVLGSTIVYDLKDRSYRKLRDFPDAIQNPPVCPHRGRIYVGGQKHIYVYNDKEDLEYWQKVVDTDVRINHMVSVGDYIYATQNYYSYLFRFHPDEDDKLDLFANFSNPVATMCGMGSKIVAFTQTVSGQNDLAGVEEFDPADNQVRPLWTEGNKMKVSDVIGCCALVLAPPAARPPRSAYVDRHWKKYRPAVEKTMGPLQ